MSDSGSRTYRKRKRAEAEEETRRRITEAAVELHGTVGPARTTLTQVAELAGVSRMTVYNHFPSEVDLYAACSSHWAARNPFPDPGGWTAADPSERLGAALEELYGWYALKRGMLGNVLRDAGSLPALAEVMDGLWEGYMDSLVQALAEGWPETSMPPRSRRALLRLAVDFHTWTVLADSGLAPGEAAEAVVRLARFGALRAPRETGNLSRG